MKDAPVLTRWSIQVRDWLGSDTLRGMSLEAEALFLRLCLDQWEHGAARPEKERWRKVHGNRCSDFETAWNEASAPFQVTPLGLVHPRVARDREVAIQQIEAKVRGARRTNEAKRTHSERSPHAERALSGFSASASASASVEEEEAADAARGFLAFGTMKEMGWEVQAVVTALRNLSGFPFLNAGELHETAQSRLMGLGFTVDREVPIDVSEHTRDGRMDLVVRTEPPIAIELDRKTPRAGSVVKLKRAKEKMGAVTILVIRAKGWSGPVEADLLIALADPNEVEKPEEIEIPKALDTPEFRTALDEWFAYRRERRLPKWQPSTVRTNYKQWAAWGVEKSIEAIRTSIRSSWAGVFEPKENGSNGYRAQPKNGSHAVPSAQQTSKMLEELRRTPTIAPPSNVRELFEEAKRKAQAAKA